MRFKRKNMLCLILLVIIAVILLLHVFVEFYYFIRAGICVLYARVCKTKTHVLDETRITGKFRINSSWKFSFSFVGFCIPRDVDHLLTHMNNARFLRELDFAKVDFFERTGLFRRMYKDKGHFFVSATTIRYRRFIKLFSRYIITTRVRFTVFSDASTELIRCRLFIGTIRTCTSSTAS